MATNYLTPFANDSGANVHDETTWQSLSNRTAGFQSGIASSSQFNRVFAQGATAGYVLGQFVVDFASTDATIQASSLYTAFQTALNSWQGTSRTLTANQQRNARSNIDAVSSTELSTAQSTLQSNIETAQSTLQANIDTKVTEDDLLTALSDLIAEFGGTVPTD